METLLADLALMFLLVAGGMEVVVKFGTKVGLPKLFESAFWQKYDFLPDLPPEEEIKKVYGAAAFVLGWILAFTVFEEVSVFRAFDRIPNMTAVIVLDHLLVGFIAGMGEKKAHDVLGWIERVFGILDKTGRMLPFRTQEALATQEDIFDSLRSALSAGEYALAESLLQSAAIPGTTMVSPDEFDRAGAVG